MNENKKKYLEKQTNKKKWILCKFYKQKNENDNNQQTKLLFSAKIK